MKSFVLIVDDEFGLADITADVLSELGYDVAIAINGKLGLEAIAARPPDLVLTDAMMPVLDGPEMIRTMRKDPALAKIPVILMTAMPEAVPRDVEGAPDAVLFKPFRIAQLIETIERLLGATSSPA